MHRHGVSFPGIAALAALAAGFCGCSSVPDRPPRTMGPGLIGYVTACKFLPTVSANTGGAGVKCSLAKVVDETNYQFGTAALKQAEDLFETEVFNGGHGVAAKEAIAEICRKIGANDISELWDPARLDAFLKVIQQEGITVVDYLLLVRLTGVSPSLQAQAKIVSTRAGPDWGQQIPVRVEIDWKKLCEAHGVELTPGGWDAKIRAEQGCGGSRIAPTPPSPAPASVPASPSPNIVPTSVSPPAAGPCVPEGKDLLRDIERCFTPELVEVGGDVAVFPLLWQKEDDLWVVTKLGEEVAAGLEKQLRSRRVVALSGGGLERALQADGNRSFAYYCDPEDAADLGQRIFSAKAVVGGVIERVKPNAFSWGYRVRLWCRDWTGREVASFEHSYGRDALAGELSVERSFETRASRQACARAATFDLKLDDEVRWAVNDMLYGMHALGLLSAGENLLIHPSGHVKAQAGAKSLAAKPLGERLIGVVGAVEYASDGKTEVNPSAELVAWATLRLGATGLKLSTILDRAVDDFIGQHVEAFKDAPDTIKPEDMAKLIPEGRPVPDTMLYIKLRPPLVAGSAAGSSRPAADVTLSFSWRDVASGEVIAWAEYKLPGAFGKQVGDVVTPTFFGQPLAESRLVFVVDVSGSMKELLPRLSVNRLEVAKQELVRLVDSLPPDRQFQILPFAVGVGAWSPTGLVDASPTNKAAAVGFVRSLTAAGDTPARQALEKAFEYESAQAVCFLSDGEPTDASPEQIIALVKQRNAPPRLKVNTFSFDGANVNFMARLAQENGGVYYHIQ